jgi:hypothetical protein
MRRLWEEERAKEVSSQWDKIDIDKLINDIITEQVVNEIGTESEEESWL